MAEQLRLLAVHAHPDDESSKGAATLARYRDEGLQVMVATCTGGERGDILNPKMVQSAAAARDITGLRREEMAAAAAILGIEHRWLGFVDSGLPEGEPLPPLPSHCFARTPLHIAAAPLVKLVREYRPHVLVTYDENGGYPHPDHIKCHQISVEAYRAAGKPDAYPEAGEPWQISKLYYDRGFNVERLVTLHQALLARGMESPFEESMEAWLARAEKHAADAGDVTLTTHIECSEYFAQRDRALLAHETQIDPDSRFFFISTELQATVWPWEDYQLVESSVPTTLPEDDLFSGLR